MAYIMAEERRMLSDGSIGNREEKKKAHKHQRTKAQQEMLCQQLVEKSAEYAERVSLEIDDDDNIPSVKRVAAIGRRKQDKDNLSKQIAAEDAKSSRLTRVQLTLATIQEVASKTKPTNDATFTFDGTVILWRDKVEEMCTVNFWNKLKPKAEFKSVWKMARRAFIHLDAISLTGWHKKKV
jgi:hypothetical protein